MSNKIYSILLIISFILVINKPLIVMGLIYIDYTAKTENKCCCDTKETKIAKMRSNGDTYLKALLKRVCKDNKKNRPVIPGITITVFVKDLTKDYLRINYEEKQYQKISRFLILHKSDQFPLPLFRPPNTLSFS